MADGTMVKTIYLKAPRERVWAYITEPDKLVQWFHDANRNLGATGSYEFFSFDPNRPERKLMWGEVLEADPPSKLVYTFLHEWLGEATTTVTWELREVAGGTELTMRHEGFETAANALDELIGHDKGWDEHFLRLRLICC